MKKNSGWKRFLGFVIIGLQLYIPNYILFYPLISKGTSFLYPIDIILRYLSLTILWTILLIIGSNLIKKSKTNF